MKIKTMILFVLLTFSPMASAKLMVEVFNNFTSSSDDHSGTFDFSSMTNGFFFGATLSKKKVYFGQSLIQYSRSFNDGSSTEVSILELGPRFTFFLNEACTWHINAIWNPYAKGDRTSSGATESMDGWSYEIALGYQHKVTKTFYMGATIAYHSLSITSVTNNSNTESETSYTYSSIYPMITLNFRF